MALGFPVIARAGALADQSFRRLRYQGSRKGPGLANGMKSNVVAASAMGSQDHDLVGIARICAEAGDVQLPIGTEKPALRGGAEPGTCYHWQRYPQKIRREGAG